MLADGGTLSCQGHHEQGGRRTHSDKLWKKGIQSDAAVALHPGRQTPHAGEGPSDPSAHTVMAFLQLTLRGRCPLTRLSPSVFCGFLS